MQLTHEELEIAISIGNQYLSYEQECELELLSDARKIAIRSYIIHKYGDKTKMPTLLYYNYTTQKRI